MDPKTPAGTDQEQPDAGKTKVVNYLFKPSGEAVMQGQLVYEKEKDKKGLFNRKKEPVEFKPNSHLGSGYYQGPEVEHPEDYIQPPASFTTTVTPGAATPEPAGGNGAPPSYGSFAGYTGGAPSGNNNNNNNSGSKFSFLDILLFPFRLIGMLVMAIWKLLGMIKQLIIALVIITLLAAMGAVLILLYKPPFFWNPVKTLLNKDIDPAVVTEVTADFVYNKINTAGLAGQTVILTDSETTRLIRDYTNLDQKCFVTTDNSSLNFYVNIDTAERPLWFVVSTVANNYGKLAVQNAGFGSFNTPEFFTSWLNDTLGIVFQFVEKQVTAPNQVVLFQDVLDKHKLNKNLELTGVQLEPGKLILNFTDHSKDNGIQY